MATLQDSGEATDGGAAGAEDKVEPKTTMFAQRLTGFYSYYDANKAKDVESLVTKYAGNESALFSALSKKYGPEPEHEEEEERRIRRILLKYYPPARKEALQTQAFFFAQTSIEPIQSAMERGAASVGGEIKLTRVRTADAKRGREAGSAVLELWVKAAKGEEVDPILVGSLRELVHNRHKIASGRKTGLLLAQGDIPEHERRKIEKKRSQRGRGRPGGLKKGR
jgi:hypothetical protein